MVHPDLHLRHAHDEHLVAGGGDHDPCRNSSLSADRPPTLIVPRSRCSAGCGQGEFAVAVSTGCGTDRHLRRTRHQFSTSRSLQGLPVRAVPTHGKTWGWRHGRGLQGGACPAQAPCAIKLIKAASETDAASIARFEKEVKTTAKLTHWNTIEIYDYGRTDDGTFYYVMELLPGKSLEDLVEKHGPLPPERVVYLLRQVCGALQEAHSVGLIHRDIKPANIFVSQRGGVYDVAKLLDFGLVKERSDKSDTGTKYGSFRGTPLYMSPEQASAYEEVDGRADIYSLGAAAYYLLTGQTPFTSKSVLELLAAHRNSEVALPSKVNPAVPSDLEQVILKCMAKNPSDRFQDADELRKALDQCGVASQWGPDQAALWWKAISERATDVPVEKTPVDATMDYQPNES